MAAIASATGGRYYFPQDPAELPSIFIKEAKTLKRNIVQNRTFVPAAGFPSPILKGIETVPPLHGLVLTMAKPRAQTVLLAKIAETWPVIWEMSPPSQKSLRAWTPNSPS